MSLGLGTLARRVGSGADTTQRLLIVNFLYFYISPITHILTMDSRLSAPLHSSGDKVKSNLFLLLEIWGPPGPLCAQYFARCYVKVLRHGALVEDSHKRFMNVLNKSLAWVCLDMEC